MPQDPKLRPYTPVLGLLAEDDRTNVVRQAIPEEDDSGTTFELSVILPARNEEMNLPQCLESLLAQDDELFKLGTDWELILVDDDSTDRTAVIARAAASRPGVVVMQPPALEAIPAQRTFTGKNNACWAGAQRAQGRWLLFTDADTLHESNDLRHALHEAKKHEVALLSYSPRQIVNGLAQRVLMPLVFSELASVYPTSQVNDPNRRLAAANGQFLMIERRTYFAVGGHKAVAKSVLEDVEIAYNIKRSKKGIRFRYAPDALSTRMYRGFRDMVEGWTKNLALLFPHAVSLAFWRLLDLGLCLLPLVLLLFPYLIWWQKGAIWLLWARTLLRFYRRVARSNFSFVNCALSVFGLPLFLYLLIMSWMSHRVFRRVTWKGREIRTGR